MTVMINRSCIGCGACVQTCPDGALSIGPEGIAVVDQSKCTDCGKCVSVCPVSAMSLPPNAVQPEQQSEQVLEISEPVVVVETQQSGDKVWVFVEQTQTVIAPVTLELIGEATRLAKKLNTQVGVVLLGDQIECLAQPLFDQGADKVYLVDHNVFNQYRTEAYFQAVCYLVRKYYPEILLMGATTMGRDLAGAVATDLGTGLTADCTQLDIDLDKKILLASRPAFGGNIMATILCERHRPQMAMVRPKVMKALEPVVGRNGMIIREFIDIPEESIPKQVLSVVHDQLDQINLAEAKIIVAGGRGMREQNGFEMLKELANILGGVVGGSRGATESGCLEIKRQIGQTGQTVAPTIYFAIGISGAIQHVVGMQRSEVIIAINTDRNCAMMKMATYPIVGDAYTIMPELIKQFSEAMANRQQEGSHE